MKAPMALVTEHSLQKASIKWLNTRPGVLAYTVYNGAVPTVRGRWKPNSSDRPAGFPDALFIVNGVTYYLEFKSAKGKLSPAQLYMHSRINACGASVYVVRSFGELQRVYQDVTRAPNLLELAPTDDK